MINDIRIFEEGSGGDFNIVDNDIEITNSLRNQVYLAFFGGNIKDDVGEQNNDYWANSFFNNEQKYVSNFERTILSVPLNSSGLQKIKSAADQDLKYLKQYAEIKIDISIESKDLLYLYIEIKAPNNISEKIRLIWNNTDKTWQL